MWRGVVAGSVAIITSLGATVSTRADPDRVRDCMSPEQAHELLTEQKFVAPFRALREATHGGPSEAVGLELCRFGEAYVYDVTLLHRDGRVSHALVNARTGLVIPARAK